jgi:GNAT superfamily N-acetyltransferase
MASVTIVPARPEWAWCLSSLALAAKAHWHYPVSWLHAWADSLTITPAFIRSNHVFAARLPGRIAGFYAIELKSGTATLEHLWVLPKAMGQGIGRTLVQHAAAHVQSLGCFHILIESDPNASHFYQHCGARLVSHTESVVEGVVRRLPILELATSKFA